MDSNITALGLAIVYGATLFIYGMWRVLNRYAPWFYGASLSDVMWGLDNSVHGERRGFRKLSLRFVPPVIGGIFVGWLFPSIPWYGTALAGAQAALLAVWPNVIRPEGLPWPLWNRRQAVYVIYVLFGLACAVASLFGRAIGELLAGRSGNLVSTAGGTFVLTVLTWGAIWVVRTGWNERVQAARREQWDDEQADRAEIS